MTTRLRDRIDAGEPAYGAWISIPSPLVAEALAVAGFDYVCIDCQHGFAGADGLWPLLQAVAHADVTPLVRVPSHDPAFVGRALDAGAAGVIVPLVERADTAAALAAACRYAPDGTRSYGGGRAAVVGGRRPAEVNADVLCLVMVETAAGLAAADAIAATPGIDGIYVGPSDLALSLGLDPAEMMTDARHLDAVATVQAACARAGVIAAIHTAGPADALARVAAGFTMCTTTTDFGLLRAGARRDLQALHAAAPGG